ncbi:hypothetical protein H6G97_24250 [Nostoc flagelliforme FACHB-838]|uniref:Uncharacterized protein n=1 Tax=Nostoc flagelliforme FACHB-838 TaxID=2692904 RepID=A0ABR8DSU3_9NOSO|nr:hypothetical protein [Nostoc flagelliforme FACHB-838]
MNSNRYRFQSTNSTPTDNSSLGSISLFEVAQTDNNPLTVNQKVFPKCDRS